jgi:hypothetical protein
MKRLSNAVFASSLVGVVALAACGGSSGEEATEGAVAEMVEVPASPEAIAAANALTSRLAETEVTLVPTQRGLAPVGYTQPEARQERDFIVTTIRIRNQAANAIAGLQVDEFWFDTDGNTVTGDSVRFREPIMPGEVIDVELRVPRNSAMDRSNYEFSHQNGDIEANLVDELPDPIVEEQEGEEGEEAEEEAGA